MTMIFGHRGAAGTFPENTMPSFYEAERLGADGIELDVQMTKDGVVVVIHDETIDRTTDSSGFVHEYTYDQLVAFDASCTFHDKTGFCHIPTLEEVMRWIQPTHMLINIELKNNKIAYRGLEEETINLIRKYSLEERSIVSSFNHMSMRVCSTMAPDIETAILYRAGLWRPWRYAKNLGASAVHPNYKYMSSIIARWTLANGIAVRPYTVNDEKKISELLRLGVSAIITDYPERAKQLAANM